jgi:hypothetical protein
MLKEGIDSIIQLHILSESFYQAILQLTKQKAPLSVSHSANGIVALDTD